jgi:Flp pilus assembly protein TadG
MGAIEIATQCVTALMARFAADNHANVAVITAIAAMPTLAAVGCGVDYTMASMARTKLLAAADTATLATVSANSPIVASAKLNGDVSKGATYATNFFNAGATAINNSFNLNVKPTASVTMSGTKMTAVVSFTGQYTTNFMGLIGFKKITIAGSSTATYSLPVYIDFYLMLDVSGSMGMPSTAAEQDRLQAVNPDNMGLYPTGCTFACHFTAQNGCGQGNQGPTPAVGKPTNPSPGGYCQGFIISRLGTIQHHFRAAIIRSTATRSIGITRRSPRAQLQGPPPASSCAWTR